jgi:hypothetical protein
MSIPPLARAQSDPCPNGILLAGNGGDIVIAKACAADGSVPNGLYQYGNINIIADGSLSFADAVINLWAKNILVENGGTLAAGTPDSPIGTNDGTVTIHLYGEDQNANGSGVPCVSDDKGQCGIPDPIWSSNGSKKVCINGKDPNDPVCNDGILDYFYQYMPIDYDGANPKGYFGYKVLGVSYGGTLRLYGKRGAVYDNRPVSDSGTSWARLAENVSGGNTLEVDRVVTWQTGDKIVVTTTDYLPGHSEELTVTGNNTSDCTVDPKSKCSIIKVSETIQYPHAGRRYSLSAKDVPNGIGPDPDPNLPPTKDRLVETRAAVGLLTRSIQIVSGGNGLLQEFPPETDRYYFGGHTLFRQGFKQIQVQGVEFRQMGQGGKIMHYSVHFHMARLTPSDTFVADSSVNESMTRWIVLHATEGVTVARNVGWKSIGHGFYLEDGTEADNHFYSNLGVFARAAVEADPKSKGIEKYNPRHVPGILAAPYPGPDQKQEQVPYHTDVDHPTGFWMMNTWNDFQYNHIAGAGTCGACYWMVPGYISGMSRFEKWEGYAGEQRSLDLAGTTPMKSFVGNSCSSAMVSFNTVGDTSDCNGVVNTFARAEPKLTPVLSLAPKIKDARSDAYYPKVVGGGSRYATECPGGDCSLVTRRCDFSFLNNCAVTILDHFTSSFSWAQTNFGSVWFRPQWYLYINSALTDAQNGGLTIVTGGGYTSSDSIPGHWALAKKDVFIGNTQPNTSKYASNVGPVTPDSGLVCAKRTDALPSGSHCLVRDGQGREETVTLQVAGFSNNQRLLNIYDGPAYEGDNAYLDTTTTTITGCKDGRCGDSYGANSLAPGLPKDKAGRCYLPNAAIGWKQPNGFYYPPAFHSKNLFFNNVEIRHFVIEPLFEPGTYTTREADVRKRYCSYPTSGLFVGFSDIDRQTELTDDDGSLTGLVSINKDDENLKDPTISVNEDDFFNAPLEAPECASDAPAENFPESATAKTSPYDYVTTVIYPYCGQRCERDIWSASCTNDRCFGVPLYREFVNQKELGTKPFIRMASQAVGQRSNLTPNHGSFYIDTTTTPADQQFFAMKNIFEANQTYYLFLLFAKESTTQTYSMYVGTKFNLANDLKAVRMHQQGKDGQAIYFTDTAWPDTWKPNLANGVLTVTMNMKFSEFQQNYAKGKVEHCQPQNFCTLTGTTCGCKLSPGDPLYKDCKDICVSGADSAMPPDCPDGVCTGWASKDVDCPSGGCYGFRFTTASDFTTGAKMGLPPMPGCYDTKSSSPWNLQFSRPPGLDPNDQCYIDPLPQVQQCSGSHEAKQRLTF